VVDAIVLLEGGGMTPRVSQNQNFHSIPKVYVSDTAHNGALGPAPVDCNTNLRPQQRLGRITASSDFKTID